MIKYEYRKSQQQQKMQASDLENPHLECGVVNVHVCQCYFQYLLTKLCHTRTKSTQNAYRNIDLVLIETIKIIKGQQWHNIEKQCISIQEQNCACM